MTWPWVSRNRWMADVETAKLVVNAQNAQIAELRRKLTDYEQPPIESGDLQSLLKRHAFIQTKCASLEKENEQLKARIQELHGQGVTYSNKPDGSGPILTVLPPPKNTGVL